MSAANPDVPLHEGRRDHGAQAALLLLEPERPKSIPAQVRRHERTYKDRDGVKHQQPPEGRANAQDPEQALPLDGVEQDREMGTEPGQHQPAGLNGEQPAREALQWCAGDQPP
jgi:hypothetical protein